MPTEKPRFTVIVDKDLLRVIDDFRFENRFSSRSAAATELIKKGINQLELEKEASKNQDFNNNINQ